MRHVLTHTSEGVPGESYSYNGNIFSDLTWVLEDVTRVAYPRLLQERVFDPLGMDRSVPGHTRPGSTELVELTRAWAPEGEEYQPIGYQMAYALGWFVETIAGRKVCWHYGWLPPAVSALYVKVPKARVTFLLLANNDGLSRGFAWTASGVRASPFAQAFLDALELAGK
ncbi:MAG: serine hydrolase [Planctomycetes bacterium]|nr:serine hydrolase [Planctomycetota bacterium]